MASFEGRRPGPIILRGSPAQPDAWHRAEPVMRHVQHLSLESLGKMDHFRKEPPLNLKGTTGVPGGRRRPEPTILKEQIGNPAQTECPLLVISGHCRISARCPLSPKSGYLAAQNECQRTHAVQHLIGRADSDGGAVTPSASASAAMVLTASRQRSR
jgi:hypothetical protein